MVQRRERLARLVEGAEQACSCDPTPLIDAARRATSATKRAPTPTLADASDDNSDAEAPALLDLPTDVVSIIVARLDLTSRLRAAAACHALHCVVENGAIWSSVVLRLTCASDVWLGRTQALRSRLKCTEMLRVRPSDAHDGRFCKRGQLFGSHSPQLLTECGTLSDAGAIHLLRHCSGLFLRVLNLSGHGHLTTRTLRHALEHCCCLEELHLRKCWGLVDPSDDTGEGTGGSVVPLPARRTLRALDLSHTNVGDATVSDVLRAAPALVSLHLNFVERLTPRGLAALPPTVRRLGLLGNAQISYSLVRELRARLDETECDDAFLEDRATGRAAQQTIWQLLAAYYSRACWDSD